MQLKFSKLKQIIKESISGGLNPKQRWPWIQHFDSQNEEGMEHPGNWVKPTMQDFLKALSQMSPVEVEKLADRGWNLLGKQNQHDRQRLDRKTRNYVDVDWKRSNKVKTAMFDIWEDKESWAHRDEQNKYFAPSRKRDREAYDKAMENPETRKMAALVRSRDYALDRGEPWFPKDD